MNGLPTEENYESLRVSNLGCGNFFGEEIFLGSPRELKAVAKTSNAEYYVIDAKVN
jgi:hypothetical protein